MIFPNFQIPLVAKNISSILNTICFVLGYYPRSSQFFSTLALRKLLASRKRQISEHIFTPNGGYCLVICQHLMVISSNWKRIHSVLTHPHGENFIWECENHRSCVSIFLSVLIVCLSHKGEPGFKIFAGQCNWKYQNNGSD